MLALALASGTRRHACASTDEGSGGGCRRDEFVRSTALLGHGVGREAQEGQEEEETQKRKEAVQRAGVWISLD